MSTKDKSNFIIILTVAIVIAIVAIFFVRFKPKDKGQKLIEPDTQRLQTQSSSDEITSIERDLIDTDFSELDKELQDIEYELNQAY